MSVGRLEAPPTSPQRMRLGAPHSIRPQAARYLRNSASQLLSLPVTEVLDFFTFPIFSHGFHPRNFGGKKIIDQLPVATDDDTLDDDDTLETLGNRLPLLNMAAFY